MSTEGWMPQQLSRLLHTLETEMGQAGLSLEQRYDVVPPADDTTTLFTVAGMQPLKPRFANPDGSSAATLQACIRLNDIDEVGDGSHLTCFGMVGSFSFGGNNYEDHVELWHRIMRSLEIPITHVTYHPDTQLDALWTKRGYAVVPDTSCVWSASPNDPPSFCCEMFVGDLEVGNLVNPGGHSVDVGFGYERILRLLEGKDRVDETSLFDPALTPIARDHVRTVDLLLRNNIQPGNKGRAYVCRRLVRRLLREGVTTYTGLEVVLESEQRLLNTRLETARKAWRKNKDRDAFFWWDSFGILAEELPLLGV